MKNSFMLDKPSSCIGCPFYTKGKYFTPDKINPNSKVLFILQNPGANEEAGHKLIKRHFIGYGQYHDEYIQAKPEPLIGATGQVFYNKFLPYTSLKPSEVSIANAIRCRPGSALGLQANKLPVLTNKMKLETSKADIVKALKHCKEAHLQIPSSVKLVVLMGQYSLFQFTGLTDITNWRGYGFDIGYGNTYHNSVDVSSYHDLSSGKIAFATLHLAALNEPRNKRFYHATFQDFHKIKMILNGHWPKPLPLWNNRPPLTWPKYSSFDTEYSEEESNVSSELHRWSLCDSDFNAYVIESYDTSPFKLPVEDNSTVIIQNTITSDDLFHLSKIININKITIEDLMVANSVLWTGEPHNLNYINSMYGQYNRYKHLNQDNPQLYSALDAIEPMYNWRYSMVKFFKEDPLSYKVYKNYRLKLINMIRRTQYTGIPIDGGRLLEVQRILQEKVDRIKQQAIDITGDEKFNIGGSKRLKEEIYGEDI